MSIFKRIVEWQKSRGLINLDKPVNGQVESLNILEEIFEVNFPEMDSDEARGVAKHIMNSVCEKQGLQPAPWNVNPEATIDGLCDMIVFATGAIAKMGYCPDVAMDETLKEIESRMGFLEDGKFVKDTSNLAKRQWYKADYDQARLLGTSEEILEGVSNLEKHHKKG